MRRVRSAVLVGFAMVCTAFGQHWTSPPASAAVQIGGKHIRVDYYAPSMHGRCPGANGATGLTTAADLQIGALKVPKGTWSIWAIPGEKEWTLILNKQSGQHHLDYEAAEDFGRTKMTLRTLSAPVETLRIDLSSNGGNKGTLSLIWETTEASIPFTVLP
jgi:Protein of unknown function (DUF2911)